MQKRTIVLALVALMAASALLPLAQGAHYTMYHDPMPKSVTRPTMASFEGTAPGTGNQNGPAGQESRAVPAQNDIPTRFHGLTDTLVMANPLDATTSPGSAILDHFIYGSAVEAGAVVPYGYFVSQATGAPRTMPSSMHNLWYGVWIDHNGDGVIEDEWCAETGLNCGGADEFVWRGDNTGEDLTAQLYIFPGDYDASVGTAGRGFTGFDPSAWGGNCNKYKEHDDSECITPSPDIPYADSTKSATNSLNQRWGGDNGGGQWTPEEFLLVSQHLVSVAGPTAALKDSASPERFNVDGTTAQGIQRDYDWTQSMAAGGVEDLYLDTMRGIRDAVFVPVVEIASADTPNVCPKAACYSSTENAHLEAVRPQGAADAVWAKQFFTTVVPSYANTPSKTFTDYNCERAGQGKGCVPSLPAQGFYGDLTGVTNALMPQSDFVAGAYVRPTLVAWQWKDASGDGYIGNPTAVNLQLYNAGLAASPNDGVCAEGSGNPQCELTYRNGAYFGGVSTISPGSAGWPPGTVVLRNYESPSGMGPFGPGEPGYADWIDASTPLFGTNSVQLRNDPERCKDGQTLTSCRTIDAVFIPTGSALTLNGVTPVTISWAENNVPFSVSFPGVYSADL